jgi:sigma-B regulation protein RsbU (phosphoserine phosphatase)
MLNNLSLFKQEEQNDEQTKSSEQRDLEIGRQIQASFLPKGLPKLPGWEITAYFEAARQVAGDFYDVFPLSGGKRVGLVVGDVCDKGVGAALFMALFRSLIHAFAEQHYALGWMDILRDDTKTKNQSEAVTRRRSMLSTGTTALKNAIDLTNAYIYRNHGDTNMFATVFFGVLDPSNGSLIYINGGHVPPVVIGPEGIKTHLEPTGPAVGILPNLEFGIEQLDLEPRDTLLLYTDGVTDTLNPKKEFFDETRFFSILEQPSDSASQLLSTIQESLHKYMAGADQFDDITMLAVKYMSP